MLSIEMKDQVFPFIWKMENNSILETHGYHWTATAERDSNELDGLFQFYLYQFV